LRFAGLLHRFGQQEDIRRSAAGQGGHRVHARFIVDPHGQAGGQEFLTNPLHDRFVVAAVAQ
jgi:hypothetical protein